MEIKVGCCGFPAAQTKYFASFKVVELQSTFYKLPRLSTAERWRKSAPGSFEFAVKAWQVITHASSSPTWRRAGLTIPAKKRNRYGLLRPTSENLEAWNATLRICRILGATACLLQCPPKFSCTKENENNLIKFVSKVERSGVRVAWEPRGDWHGNPKKIRQLCRRLNLIHAVDPLRRQPAHVPDLLYFRLHGIGGREHNYGYRYTQSDLVKLTEIVEAYSGPAVQRAYVFFNNVSMWEDALKLKRMLGK